jgi:hypothetical protein
MKTLLYPLSGYTENSKESYFEIILWWTQEYKMISLPKNGIILSDTNKIIYCLCKLRTSNLGHDWAGVPGLGHVTRYPDLGLRIKDYNCSSERHFSLPLLE